MVDKLRLLPPYDRVYDRVLPSDSGAEAVVFAAVRIGTKEKVAIKVFKPVRGPESIRKHHQVRFEKEADQLRAVRHPHVVRVFETFDVELNDQKTTAYVMEWLPDTLRNRINRCRNGLPVDELHRAISEALAGLGALHAAGVAVRDLRPENMLLTEEGVLKLADLGMARTNTFAGSLVGLNSQYQAPEVLDGSVHRSYRPPTTNAQSSAEEDNPDNGPTASAYFSADLYSLGLIFYEAAVGVSRWECLPALDAVYGQQGLGSGLTPEQLWQQWHQNMGGALPPLKSERGELPNAICSVIDAMVVKDLNNRLGSVQAALSLLGESPGPLRETAVADEHESGQATQETRKKEGSDPSRNRPRLYWISAASLAVVVSTLLLWSCLRPRAADLVLLAAGERDVTVTWSGVEKKSQKARSQFKLAPCGRHHLQVREGDEVVVDTLMAVSAGASVQLNLATYLRRSDWRRARSLLAEALALPSTSDASDLEIRLARYPDAQAPQPGAVNRLRIDQDFGAFWVLPRRHDRLLLLEPWGDGSAAILFPTIRDARGAITPGRYFRIPPVGSRGYKVSGPAGRYRCVAIAFRSGSRLAEGIADFVARQEATLTSAQAAAADTPLVEVGPQDPAAARAFSEMLLVALRQDQDWAKVILSYLVE